MQEAVFAAVEDPKGGHLVVEAYAGAGKTSTTLEAVARTPSKDSALLVAFNKQIATELADKAPEGVDVMTLHSYGLRQITRADGRREIDGYAETARIKGDPQLAGILGAAAEDLGRKAVTAEARLGKRTREGAPADELAGLQQQARYWRRQARNPRAVIVRAVRELVGFAKSSMVGDSEGLTEIILERDIAVPPGPTATAAIIAMAQRHLAAARTDDEGPIDFDDMVWLPVVRRLQCKRYDWVFVDETQDLNPAQLALVRMAAGPRGRIVAVGDRRQAIYAFRGADANAIPRMISELQATVLPLSICYRCAANIITEAQAIVPEIQPARGAPAGIVRRLPAAAITAGAEGVPPAGPGDFVISRLNAPLVSLCFRLLSKGIPAKIRGRDIGDGLADWIRDCGAQDIPQLRSCIAAWAEGERERLEEEHRDAEHVTDREQCLYSIAAACSTVQECEARVRVMFTDGTAGITLMSAHRSKGLEAPRVWMLKDTFRSGGEEDNLRYVAITRAQRELIYVSKEA